MGSLESLPTSGNVDAPITKAVEQLESDVRALQSQLEAESGRNLQFTQQRDLNWETYKALSSKQAELILARAAANSEVRQGTPAIPPVEPVESVRLSLSVALAAVVGLLLAIFIAFMREYLGQQPLFRRSPKAA